MLDTSILSRGVTESPPEALTPQIKVVEADFWLPINDKKQLEEAEEILSE